MWYATDNEKKFPNLNENFVKLEGELEDKEAKKHKPKVILVDSKNALVHT